MKQVTIPAQWLQELIALCGPEDHELRERVMKSAAPAPVDALATGGQANAVLTGELIEAVDAWFARNTGLGGCSDKDVAELAAIFAAPQAVQLDANGIAQCPLCGSESKHVQAGADGHRILCWNDDCECSSGYFYSKEEAITSWNARTVARNPSEATQHTHNTGNNT